MIVSFCGHKELHDTAAVRRWLNTEIEELIEEGAAEFWFGGYGAFDRLAASVLKEKKERYCCLQLTLVLPYLNKRMDSEQYSDTIYPPIENVPKRYAILARNRWMAEQADVMVAYVIHDWGGAAKTLRWAQKANKRIVLYAEKS